jgi:hypothetical protein
VSIPRDVVLFPGNPAITPQKRHALISEVSRFLRARGADENRSAQITGQLFERMGFSGVTITHGGSTEKGKDIVFYTKTIATASSRFARASSSVSPCVFAPGSSSTNAT